MHALLAQMDGERRVIAVARDDDEGIIDLAVQQLDRVDHERHIRGVLAGDIVKLLLGLDGQALDLALPALERLLLPVAVGALDHDAPVGRYLPDDCLESSGFCIVCINQHDDALQILFHVFPP